MRLGAKYLMTVGAVFVVLGLARLLWVVASAQSRSGFVDSAPFGNAALIAGAGWLALKLLARRRVGRVAHPSLRFAQAALLFAFVVMLLAAGHAGRYDPKEAMIYVSSMRRQLRSLVTAQRTILADSGKYTANPDLARFGEFPEKQVQVAIGLTGDGWTARASHPGTRRTCSVYVGTTALPPATQEGVPACTQLPVSPAAVLWALGITAVGFALAAFGIAVSIQRAEIREIPVR